MTRTGARPSKAAETDLLGGILLTPREKRRNVIRNFGFTFGAPPESDPYIDPSTTRPPELPPFVPEPSPLPAPTALAGEPPPAMERYRDPAGQDVFILSHDFAERIEVAPSDEDVVFFRFELPPLRKEDARVVLRGIVQATIEEAWNEGRMLHPYEVWFIKRVANRLLLTTEPEIQLFNENSPFSLAEAAAIVGALDVPLFQVIPT